MSMSQTNKENSSTGSNRLQSLASSISNIIQCTVDFSVLVDIFCAVVGKLAYHQKLNSLFLVWNVFFFAWIYVHCFYLSTTLLPDVYLNCFFFFVSCCVYFWFCLVFLPLFFFSLLNFGWEKITQQQKIKSEKWDILNTVPLHHINKMKANINICIYYIYV